MVRLATTVTGIECATPLEAEVRELRLIAEHKPSYNRRSRFPEKVTFVKLTREPWPRLSLVKRVLDDDADYLGPFASRKVAEKCLAALHDTFPVRQCSDRFGRRPSRSPCVLAEMGRCLSPCDGSVDADTYAAVVRQLRETLLRRPDDVVDAINARMAALAADERFEEAGVHRDRLAAFVRAAARTQRLTSLTRCPEVVAARREDDGRWAVHVVRYGRLAAAGVIPPGADAHLFVAQLRATAETVAPSPGPLPAATAEESERILRWLESPVDPADRDRRRVDLSGQGRHPLPRHASDADRAHAGRAGRGAAAFPTTLGAMITAIVFVNADVARIPEVAEAIAALDGVSEVYSVTGQIDLIAMVRVRDHDDVATVVADKLNKVDGVLETETHIAFRAYSSTTSSRRTSVSCLLQARPGVGVLTRARLRISHPGRRDGPHPRPAERLPHLSSHGRILSPPSFPRAPGADETPSFARLARQGRRAARRLQLRPDHDPVLRVGLAPAPSRRRRRPSSRRRFHAPRLRAAPGSRSWPSTTASR